MIIPDVSQHVKDLFEIGAWTIAIIGGGVAACAAIIEMRSNTKQRFAELRWKRANAAREIIDDIHNHCSASSACTMMDWHHGKHEYELASKETVEISYTEVLSTLAKSQKECVDEKTVFIADCFDWFFYFVDRIEHYIQSGLVDWQDVRAVFQPYARKIKQDHAVYGLFMDNHGYELARAFWSRYVNLARPKGEAARISSGDPSKVENVVIHLYDPSR